MGRPLDKLRIRGFKSIRELPTLELSKLNVLIGANGSGKTNFISFFTMLSEMVNGRLQTFVGKSGGPETLLYRGSKCTSEISAELYFDVNGYGFKLEPTDDDRLMFSSELTYFGGVYWANKTPWTEIGSGHFEALAPERATQKGSIADYVIRAISGWRVFHFHDTSATAAVKRKGDIEDNSALRADASNLAAFLYGLSEKHPDHYEAIRDVVRQIAPFFDDFKLEPDFLAEDKIALRWAEQSSDITMGAHQMSDGTLRFVCLATLMLQPNPPTTIIVDEPELGLHPYAITMLANLVKSASQRTQVILSTQSVPLVNEFEAQNLLVVDRADEQTVLTRPEPDALKDWLEDYTLGELWEKNVLGGRPSR